MDFEYGDRIKSKASPGLLGAVVADTWLGYRILLDEPILLGGMEFSVATILYHLAEKD